MAEKEIQADEYKTPRRPVLRAKDIIPGVASPVGKGEGVSNIDIPRFDLAEDIMAEQRRLTVVRRKGPADPEPVNLTPSPGLPVAVRPSQSSHSFSGAFNDISDPIIADIVTRDIERLCSGFWA
ncbi:MAG: hypothetical protein ABR913_07975 [Sedimentisphaerales bacterium]|jgi:hypothetical protein